MNYLVTGASGFIGRHLLGELLKRPGAQVYALVRASSRGRFGASLRHLGAGAERVHVVEGDLTRDGLLTDEGRLALGVHIDHVFHLAAVYDMGMTDEEAAEVNCRGTERVVAFVNSLPRPVVLHHVSSVAVAGAYVEGTFREQDFDLGQELDHPYYRSKFEAERIVRTKTEVPYRVYRPGIVVGHSETGDFEKVDGPYYFFALVRRLAPLLPRWLPLFVVEGGKMPIVPVDFVAAALDRLAHVSAGASATYALVAPEPPSVGSLVQTLVQLAGGPKIGRLHVPALARWGNRLLRMFGRVVPSAVSRLVARATGVPPSVFGQLFTQTNYDDTNARVALATESLACASFERIAPTLWEGWLRKQAQGPVAALAAPRT